MGSQDLRGSQGVSNIQGLHDLQNTQDRQAGIQDLQETVNLNPRKLRAFSNSLAIQPASSLVDIQNELHPSDPWTLETSRDGGSSSQEEEPKSDIFEGGRTHDALEDGTMPSTEYDIMNLLEPTPNLFR